MKPPLWNRIVYWALGPVAVLLVVHLVYMEATRRRGPFGQGEARMVLLNNAINLLFAEVFQGVLVVFLGAIGWLIWDSARDARLMPSVLLPGSLILIYGLSVLCAVLIARGMPDFITLVLLGLAIIALTWTALIAALRIHIRRAPATG